MTKLSLSGGMSRRTFLQVSAAGVVTATALGGIGRASAERLCEVHLDLAARHARSARRLSVTGSARRWAISATSASRPTCSPGPSDGTATVKFVDVGQADMGFPSPGVFSFALENGMKLKSAFHMGARDTFSLAFRKGEGTNDLKTLEGKTILLGSAAWQSIVDPMLAVQGVDITKVKYVEAGWPTWGTALAGGPGRRGALLGRPARRMDRHRARLRILARRAELAAVRQHLRRPRRRPRRSRQEGLPRQVPARLGDGPRIRLPQPARRGRSGVRAVPDARHQHRAGARHHLDPAADQRLPRRHGQAQGLGLARHGALADLLRQDLRARSRSPSRSRPRTSAPTTASVRPTTSTTPRSRPTPTATS